MCYEVLRGCERNWLSGGNADTAKQFHLPLFACQISARESSEVHTVFPNRSLRQWDKNDFCHTATKKIVL